MTEPLIEQSPGSISFTWASAAIRIIVSRYSNKKDAGEIKIQHLNGAKAAAQLEHQTLNFMAPKGKPDLIKFLKGKYAEGYQWEQMINDLCYHTLEIMRRGEPVELVGIEGEVEPQEWLLHPILPMDEPTVIFGRHGSGKSMMGQFFYTLVTSPGAKHDEVLSQLGLRLRDEPLVGIYLDWESNPRTMKWRAQAMARGMRIYPPPIIYRKMFHPLAQDIEAIQDIVAEHKATFVLIDSLLGASAGDANKTEPASDFFAALRSLNVSSLIIAHHAKDPGSNKTIYGNTIFGDRPRHIWEIQSEVDNITNTRSVAFTHNKHNISPKFPDIGFQIRIDNDANTIIVERDDEAARSVLPETQPEAAMRILAGGSMHYTKLASEIGISPGSCNSVLERLMKQEKVTRLGKGMYGLRFPGDE